MNNKDKNINEKELEILKFWKENKIFEKSLERPAGRKPRKNFTFYDGPPFATGLPHHGHLLASTIKDVIPRFQTMLGKRVRRVWGWDTHGLPIENLIEKKFNLNSKKDIEEFGIDKFNHLAMESVLTYEEEWQKIIPRFGRWVNMENAYKTMDTTYMESVWWAFSELNKKNLVYEGYKSMHICPRCETTLAQSEVAQGYKDLTDISLTAKFELEDEPNTFVLAWTTTPWTLPGNVALAVNENLDYVKVIETVTFSDVQITTNHTYTPPPNPESYILAKDIFLNKAEKIGENGDYKFEGKFLKILKEFQGKELIGKKYKPVFDYYENVDLENKKNIYKVVPADFVTMDTGTGIVHIAPAFGEDDLNLAKSESLPIIRHVGMDGRFVKEVKDFAGEKVKTNTDNQSADIEIIKNLAHRELLFSKEKIVHSYPTCWRCATPLLNYATSSWFIKVPEIKNKLLKANQKINWVPETIKDGRFGKWLEGARDWAVSRSRYWGAVIPIWKEIDGEDIKIVGSIKELAKNNFNQSKNEYYIMRHGQSEHNVKGIEECSMSDNDKLTKAGIQQVEKVLKQNKVKFDLIITSPYLRTKETAKIMSEQNITIIEKDEFREFNSGKYDCQSTKEMKSFYGKDFLKLKTKIGGGESHQAVMDRVMLGIMNLEKEYLGKKILIVSHGTTLQMLLAGGELYTEEEIMKDGYSSNPKLYLKNAELKKLNLQIVPRDITGKINLHRSYIDEIYLKSKNGKKMERIKDVFDCWFESGSMPYAQFHYPFENKKIFKKNFPAQFIAEGLDQTRGWFYSLLNLSVGIFNKSSYQNVIVNGIILASDGEKMSKSKNNYTDPMILVEKYGADAFRQTLLSSPAMCAENVLFSDKSVEETYKKVIAKLENVLSFYELLDINIDYGKDLYLQNLNNPIDIWILNRLAEVIINTKKQVLIYRLDLATRPFEKFIDDLSTWWLRRNRVRLKDGVDKEIAQKVLNFILNEFAKNIAPFMPFLAERVYQKVNQNNPKRKESVHLESFPKLNLKVDGKVLKEMEIVREIVTEALMIRQKNNIPVRQPLAKLWTRVELDNKYFEMIKEEVNVKSLIITQNKDWYDGEKVKLDLEINQELREEGEYRELIRKIKDFRKEVNLTMNDKIILNISTNQETKELIEKRIEDLKKDCQLLEIKISLGEDGFRIEK